MWAQDLSGYCFNGGPTSLMVVSAVLFAGSVYLVRGLRERKRDRLASRRDRSQWKKDLYAFGVAYDEITVSRLSDAVATRWNHLRGYGLIGSGTALIIAAIAGSVFSFHMTGTLILWSVFDGAYAVVLPLGFTGYGLGFAYAVWKAHRSLAGVPRYTELRPRRLSAYRRNAIPLALTGFIVMYAGVTAVSAPYLGRRLHIGVAGGAQYLVPANVVSLSALLVVMAIVLFLGELLMARIVALPRLVSDPDPAIAMKIDDMLRLKALATIQGTQLLALACLAMLQLFIISWGTGQTAPEILGTVQQAVMFAAALVGLLGWLRYLPLRDLSVARLFRPELSP